MKRPTWATVVGILGIIFGCFGILFGGQEIFMPKMMEFQKEMMTQFEKDISKQQEQMQDKSNEQQDEGSQSQRMTPEMFESMKRMFDVPEWFGTWSLFSGVSKALISGLYLLASIWLLQTKASAIRIFYWAAGSSIALSIIKALVLFSAMSFMGMAFAAGGVFGIIIDIVLIIVVITGNKEAFQLQAEKST